MKDKVWLMALDIFGIVCIWAITGALVYYGNHSMWWLVIPALCSNTSWIMGKDKEDEDEEKE